MRLLSRPREHWQLVSEFSCGHAKRGSVLTKYRELIAMAGRIPRTQEAGMRYISLALLPIAALLVQAPAAQAIPMTFVGNLSGANEVPLVSPAGTGTVKVVLDPTAQTLELAVT